MTIAELDLDAIDMRALAATREPWHVEYLGEHGYPQRIANDAAVLVATTYDGTQPARNAEFIAAARTDVPALIAEVRRFKPVAFDSGEQLYVHRCNQLEWWHEATQGPIDQQGCDGCKAGPDGGWRPVFFREVAE